MRETSTRSGFRAGNSLSCCYSRRRRVSRAFETSTSVWEATYHLGLETVAKSTLSDANNNRSADIFRNTFYALLEKCRELSPRHGFKFKNPLYSFDSTLIDVCLSLYPWATYRTKKGAFKLHTLLDHSGYLPSFLVVTDGKTHDLNVVKDGSYGFPSLSPDSILLVDRAYIDYNWLYSLAQNELFSVVKAKSTMKYTVLGQQDVPKKKGVVSDHLKQKVKRPIKQSIFSFILSSIH